MDGPVAAAPRTGGAPRLRGPLAVAVAAAAVAVLAAACVAGAWYAGDTLDGVTGPHCRTAPESLLDEFARDPALTADVPGTEVTARRRANPCDPGEESPASVTVVLALTPGAGWTDVRGRYGTLLTGAGWTLAPAGDAAGDELCATRPVDGRVVVFRVRRTGPAAVEAALSFFAVRRDANC
ncbi:hypothetical protein OHA72_23605 [Dactylosporangium sp. NBC_01737]|uniref:hypothetical protein n=1 Tax=Dactylosporangium sp. NBC_01737 TaxID=2975959 RepID=UPI002E118FFA|nr:hypothetical protein OHA72_23605 [Dactylosporangium sp. NBC_01737]